MSDRLDIEQWAEVTVISATGKPVYAYCTHNRIPGLDADGCRICKTWFVNQQMRDILVPPKEKRRKP